MTTASPHAGHAHVSRGNVRNAAMTSGIVLFVIGVLGFIPGITMAYGEMAFAGGSEAKLLNVFQVSVLLNIVYLVVGGVGYIMSRTASGAREFLMGAGILYLAMWLYGLIVGPGEYGANFLSTNTATNWLHFVLGAVMLALGITYMMRRGDEAHETT
ncbi:DUF4383 domain-containing protein [Arthrobacter sp.]|uniref:DUF4383 domain-containing protein n=1 Tax=Arthrobacter sp. TaxID=1667 RepID=UPI003394C0C3